MRLATLALSALVLATPAAAATPALETVPVKIEFADIDLASAEGRAILEARIDAQLKQACTIETNSRYGYGRDIIDETCIADARAEVLAKVERVAAAEARSGGAVSAN
jgi:UrcA family protein